MEEENIRKNKTMSVCERTGEELEIDLKVFFIILFIFVSHCIKLQELG